MIRIDENYSDYRDDTDPDYPGGKAVNVPDGESIEGTPYLAEWMNDINGFRQALYTAAFGSINTISNTPDNANESDSVKAIKKLLDDAVKTVVGSSPESLNTLGKLAGAKEDKANKALANGYASLDADGKVPLSQMSDVIKGQMVHAGQVNANTALAMLTDNGKAILGTASASITLTNNTVAVTGYKANQGNYYLVEAKGTFAGVSFDVGDWLVANAGGWGRIKNTDAVTAVKGDTESIYRTGNVNLSPADVGAVNVITFFGEQNGTGDSDPNTTEKPLALLYHPNCPIAGKYWYIRTYFYNILTGARFQMAYAYGSAENGANGTDAYFRTTYHSPVRWGQWYKLAKAVDLPTNVSKTVPGLCPKLPNETNYEKYFRQDGTWEVPPDKKYATLVVGVSSNAAAKNVDIDYLVPHGVINTQTYINNAISALPAGGGKIIILEGFYSITGPITVNRDNVTIEGMGASTQINGTRPVGGVTALGFLIDISGNYCKIKDLRFTNSSDFGAAAGINVSGNNNVITGDICSNSNGINVCWGINVSGGNNVITGNICYNSSNGNGSNIGINVGSNGNVITGNICSNSSNGNGTSDGINVSGNNSVITGNICSNSGNGTSIGIIISGNGHAVNNNVIKNSRTSGQSAFFAMHIMSSAYYCAVHGNNLRGVTAAGGAAFTQDGANAWTNTGNLDSQGKGSATVIAKLNTGGSCGFNIE